MPDEITHPPPTNTRSSAPAPGRVVGMLLVLIQLALLAAVVRLFHVEQQRHFFPLLCLLIGGFAIHAWLPAAWRTAFFAGLSLASVLFVLGAVNGLWVLAIGAGLIGICRLPVRFAVRLALLVVATAVLVACRVWFPAPYWPVLGSLFMFRLILYVYEQRKQTRPEPLAETAAYLFMAPNVSFPLFPVVDYRTFRNSWSADESWAIRQRGVTWMVRGVAHLLLYRYVKAELVPQPHELYDLPHVALFMATNYALYLQVSGQFHVITGLLHVFGFDLPRTHHQYFLASSFSDIWRRINIYWKDFMSKCFFFPTLYALRGRGASMNVAIVAGVFAVFVATWLLHSWQTFWLLGRFPLTVNDAALWLGAGVCMAVNALIEARRSGRRSVRTWRTAVIEACCIVGMFGLVSLFWALWTRPGFLVVLRGVLQRSGAGQGSLIVAGWAALAVIGVLVWNGLTAWSSSRRADRRTFTFRETAQLHAVALGLIVAASLPQFGKLLGPRAAHAIADFRTDLAAQQSAADRLQGYYEDLNMAAIQAGPLVQSFSPDDESRREQAQGFRKVSRAADLYQGVELRPGISIELEGRPFTVNEFGMRDRRELSLFKPPRTLRIAVIGSSIVMGYGVGDDEVFCRVFEKDLNAARDSSLPRVEVLNFGVGSQWATNRLVRSQRMVFGFDPDVLVYIAHQDEFEHIDTHPAKLLGNGLQLPSHDMEDVARAAGVEPDMTEAAIQGRLSAHRDEMLGAVYRSIVEECRNRGVLPVYVYLPMPGSIADDPGPQLLSLVKDAGFQVADLTGWAGETPPGSLFSSSDTQHPNPLGHRLIAEALARLVSQRPELLSGNGDLPSVP